MDGLRRRAQDMQHDRSRILLTAESAVPAAVRSDPRMVFSLSYGVYEESGSLRLP
jgi:hypothetical protein